MEDSKSGTTWFRRGLQGLQDWLLSLRKKNQFYLGEWHSHPGGRPVPSSRDMTQIKEISHSRESNCQEPILMIIGGELHQAWAVEVYVWPRGGSLVKLEDREFDLR
jgi:proteasome lid subunit RPN8/RPN11